MAEEIVNLLNEAFLHEIEATLVYVRNAFLMRECKPARITEWIAIDEMRHMNWLGDLIVKRGGTPKMDHKKLDFGEESLEGYLKKQIELENEAIELYKNAIEGLNDEEVKGVLKHILDEEKRHRKEFRIQLEELAKALERNK